VVKALVERLLGEVDHVFADRERPWRERVEALALGLREHLSGHPGAVSLMIGGPVDGPYALALDERLLEMGWRPWPNGFVRGSAWDGATKRLLDAGVLVIVNSDDPAHVDGYVTGGLLRVHQETPLSIEEVRTLARNAFRIAWLPTTLRARFLDEVDAALPP
jgi:hypothetical protein